MGKKILLADDSITIQKVIELTFSDEDFEVVTVGNGRLAIEKAQEVRPDVVLCDIIMPEKDGYEVCDFIKKHPTLSGIPVLLLTGAFEPFDQERAVRVGCDGFLAKPFEPQTLIAKVKDLLNQASSKQASAARAPLAAHGLETPAAASATYVPIAAAAQAPESPVSFIPEEPFADEPATVFEEAGEVMPEAPESIASYDNPPMEQEFYGVGEVVEEMPDSLLPLTPEDPPAAMPLAEEDSASTVMFKASDQEWSQLTQEVPLEQRAKASRQAAQAAAADEAAAAAEPPVFEEVFEEAALETAEPAPEFEAPVAPPPVAEATSVPPSVSLSAPEPEWPSSPVEEPAEPVWEPPTPEPVAETHPLTESEALVAPPASEAPMPVVAPTPVAASQGSVPADQVAQLAQRVVEQISERVVREVAWEVIPDLAEALIKREIERLKAELQQT